MKKIFLLLTISTIILTWCSLWKKTWDNKNTSSSSSSTISVSNRPVDKEYIKNLIKDNYYPKYHALDLRNKGLSYLPDLCAVLTGIDLDNIWIIDASTNSIKDIDVNYWCLKNLQEINLSYNKIEKIQNLSNNIFLQRLYLHMNKITKIEWLENSENIIELTLWYNEITKIEWLDKLANLEVLELQSNKIESIDEWLKNNNKLIVVKLENNLLKSLKWLEPLKKIEFLSIWWNKIEQNIVDKINVQNQKYMEKINKAQEVEINQ